MTATRLNKQMETHVINVSDTSVRSQNFAYSGLSCTIPANSIYSVVTTGYYGASMPKGIAISSSSTSFESWRNYAFSEDAASVTMGGYTPTAITLYVWVKYELANSNKVTLQGWYSTL